MTNTKKLTITALLASFLLSLSSWAQVDYYLYFPGSDIEGDTLDNTMKVHKAFELVNFEFGLFNTINIGSVSGGGGAGKASFKPLEFVAQVGSNHGAKMMMKLVAGDHVDDAVIVARTQVNGPGGGVEIFKIELKLVFFEDISIAASDGDSSILYGSMQFGAVKVTTQNFNPDGTTGNPTEMEWSRVLNSATFAVE